MDQMRVQKGMGQNLQIHGECTYQLGIGRNWSKILYSAARRIALTFPSGCQDSTCSCCGGKITKAQGMGNWKEICGTNPVKGKANHVQSRLSKFVYSLFVIKQWDTVVVLS
jgi:hypothetical protein